MKQYFKRTILSVMICVPMAMAAQPGCSVISNLQATSSHHTIGLSWESPNAGDVAVTYQVEYIALTDTHWFSFLTAERYFFISGLTPNTGYGFRITAQCSDSVGTPAYITAYTLGCSATAIDSTGVDIHLPIAYSNLYSYTQQIYSSAELTGIDTITSLTFFLADSHNIDTTPITLYLGDVSRNQFDSDFVSLTQMTQVFAGTIYNNRREVTIHFDTPFVRIADSNLVIAIDNDLNDSATALPAFLVGNGTNRSIYSTGSDDINPTNPGVGYRSNHVNHIRFGTTGCTLPACDNPIVFVAGMGDGYIDLAWNADSSVIYSCAYRPADSSAPWTIADDSITSGTYHLGGLTPGVSHEIRVTCSCSTDTLTGRAVVFLPCFPVGLPYSEDFYYYYIGDTYYRPCWKSGTLSTRPNSEYPTIDQPFGFYERMCSMSDCYLVMPRASRPLNQLQIRFDLLQMFIDTNRLILGVLNDIDDTITNFTPIDTFSYPRRSPSSIIPILYMLNTLDSIDGHLVFYAPGHQYQYIDNIVLEAIPNCAPVERCSIDSVAITSAIATWPSTRGLQLTSSYMVEYGPVFFTPGSGTQLIVFDTTVTLTGLNSDSYYELYIYSICGNDTTTYYGPVRFRTQPQCDIIDTLPYLMDFEDVLDSITQFSSNTLPTCWYSERPNGYSDPPYVTTTTNQWLVSSGTSYLHFFNGPYFVALPQFSESINNLKLSFHLYRSYPETNKLIIGTVDSVTPGFSSSFSPIDTLPNSQVYAPGIVEFYLTDYTGTANHIALFVEGFAAIDDLTVDTISYLECIAPAHVRLASRDTSSATITWRTSQAPAYRIEYGLHGFTLGTGDTITTNTRSITLTNLQPSTSYDVYITALCDTTQSTSEPLTFRTTVGQPAANTPYQCTFADSTENSAWELANGSQTNQWHIGSAIYDGTDDNLSLYVSNDNGITNAYSIDQTSHVYARRALHLTGSTYRIQYRWRSRGERNCDFLRVFLIPSTVELTPGLNPDGNANSHAFSSTTPEGWIPLDGGEGINYTPYQYFWWRDKEFDFEIPQPGEYDLVFYWANDNRAGTQPPAAIDNITITQRGCPAAENLRLANTTSTSVTLQWDDDTLNLAQKYLVEYDTAGFTSGSGHVDTATGTTHTVTRLEPQKTYDFYVTTLCDERWYADSTASLLNVSTSEPIYYTVTLQPNNNEFGRVSGSGTYLEGTVATFLALPFDGYRFDKWDDDNQSNPRMHTIMSDINLTAVFVHITDIDTIAQTNINTLTLYPNPASGTVTVTYHRPATITITDINGREMLRKTLTTSITTLDVSRLAPGNYFVRIEDEPRSPVRKLIIK